MGHEMAEVKNLKRIRFLHASLISKAESTDGAADVKQYLVIEKHYLERKFYI
ncbi:hypothetical protein [Clostridium sp. DL-VIII]|uniref:hypothetical protein n=1 Tax=Clostridium sp. DL-VIII TaxID=641107 RepID=UPI00031D9350|nr:hypothetical protein [Clostridium sp. DL-VIII]